MPKNTPSDFRTLAYVLRRTNYGEADRILNLITPTGKISVIAKGVRKAKSKLAGGVEMFSLIDLNIHQGRSDFGIVTGAKMLRYFNNLVTDLTKMELAAMILKKISVAADSSDNPEFFTIVDQSLTTLNATTDPQLVEAWFYFNFAKACGEEVNLYRDSNGDPLRPGVNYFWSNQDLALTPSEHGDISENEIKFMRLLVSAELNVASRIKDPEATLAKILPICYSIVR